jgi:DNA-directed RNA polymerase sigma subunit (sigma70/sigma32)
MLIKSVDDFFEKTAGISRLSREEEKKYAILMQANDNDAREKIVESYLILVASRIRRLSPDMQTFELIYRCISVLEKAVDEFDFLQDSESFSHRLSILLQQSIVKYFADM